MKSDVENDWFMCTDNRTGFKDEKQAITIRDIYADNNPNNVYTIVTILNKENLEVVK
tara:strand:- start:534 stop:704 length:171 start_codon:yes stop_codon:yes gene_type:complete